jgi:hypothetical protein
MAPTVDDQNPCYCPDTSAGQFLERLFARDNHAPVFVSTFARMLDDQSTCFDFFDHEKASSGWPERNSSDTSQDSTSSYAADPAGGTGRRFNRTGVAFAVDLPLNDFSSSSSSEACDSSSSVSQYLCELGGSDMNAQSDQWYDEESYDVDGKATRIPTFFPAKTGHTPSPLRSHARPNSQANERVRFLQGSFSLLCTHY